MDLHSETFEHWYYYEASSEEQELWNRTADMAYDCFGDMLFRKGTVTERYAKVQTMTPKGDIYSDDFMDGEWEDETLSLPDPVEYFSADAFRVKIVDLPAAKGMFHIREEDNIPEIVIGRFYADDESVIAHELIHFFEKILEDYAPYAYDIVFWAIYQDLKKRIENLDHAISEHLLLLNKRDIATMGGQHDLLFFVKSLNMDLYLKKEFGTVYGYDQDNIFRS